MVMSFYFIFSRDDDIFCVLPQKENILGHTSNIFIHILILCFKSALSTKFQLQGGRIPLYCAVRCRCCLIEFSYCYKNKAFPNLSCSSHCNVWTRAR